MRDYASIRAWRLQDTESGITFTGFILSLATTAAVHFGDIADPAHRRAARAQPRRRRADDRAHRAAAGEDHGQPHRRGSRLVDDLLYELRLRYVQAQQGEKRIIEP